MQDLPRKSAFKFLLLSLAVPLFWVSDLSAQLKVSFIDVGQGDAIYIELPSGRNALIDGGPMPYIVMDFLAGRGVKALDNVVLTHPHADHYTGLQDVLGKMPVKRFYDTKMDNLNAVIDDKLRAVAAAKRGCRVSYPRIGAQLDWDPQVSVQVLHSCPEKAESSLGPDINNCSIVLQLRYNGNSILLMGDAQTAVEKDILGRFGAGIRSNIIKVGHHGAANATTPRFLAEVKPKYAYISAGLDNPFGHPSMDTLNNLRSVGAAILMTTNGTQSFTIPAPRGVPYPEPLLNVWTMTPSAEYADIALTGQGAFEAVEPVFPALSQLAEQAGAAK